MKTNPLCRYGAEQGKGELREALCQRFYSHVGRKPSEIFVSDGSKCDIGRLQMMFGADTTVAVQVGFSLRMSRRKAVICTYVRSLACLWWTPQSCCLPLCFHMHSKLKLILSHSLMLHEASFCTLASARTVKDSSQV